MPKVDGFNATCKIRTIEGLSHVPVIVLSAYVHDLDTKRRAIKTGGNECLQKPNDMGRLKIVVKKYLSATV